MQLGEFFGGFSAQALIDRNRLMQNQSADHSRRGISAREIVPLKDTADAALNSCPP